MPDSTPLKHSSHHNLCLIEEGCERVRLDLDAIDYLKTESIANGIDSILVHLLELSAVDARQNLDRIEGLISDMRTG